MSLLFAAVLTVVMLKRAFDTQKFMPAGLVGAISIAMVGFYIYRLQYPLLPMIKKH